MSLRREWPLLFSGVTTCAFLAFGDVLLAELASPLRFTLVFAWLFAAIVLSAFAAVRHADGLAALLGEPFGTLALALAITAIEVTMIGAVMLAGPPVSSLARDTMFAVIMIVFNGMAGLALLVGGLRYHEQTYNLQGANSFLAVIVPIAVIGLVLPNFTASPPGPTLSPLHETMLIVMSLGLYAVFLAIQTLRHRHYFLPADEVIDAHVRVEAHSVPLHALLLLAYLVPVVVLAKQIAVPIDFGVNVLGAPQALAGFLVAALILSPESLSAVRAAAANQLQRSINLLLGSVLASISLTIPAVLAIGMFTDRTVVLGLDAVDTIMLVLTLALSMLTFASGRTNVLLGAVHLILFGVYVLLIFGR